MLRWLLLLFPFFVAACGGPAPLASVGEPADIECAPFARAETGILLYGDAADWWNAADGRYPRSSTPQPGGVLVFSRSDRLPAGHVAVVRQQISPREILVDQANWVHGHVTRGEPVMDVSEANDWSAVQVWWAPVAAMGASVYPTEGFIGR